MYVCMKQTHHSRGPATWLPTWRYCSDSSTADSNAEIDFFANQQSKTKALCFQTSLEKTMVNQRRPRVKIFARSSHQALLCSDILLQCINSLPIPPPESTDILFLWFCFSDQTTYLRLQAFFCCL